jgi:hypothetical protein
MTSHDHKKHLMGESDFFMQQKHKGVGFYSDEKKLYEKYWVVYITSLRADGLDKQEITHYKFEIVIEKPPQKRFKAGDSIHHTTPYKKTKD